MNYSIDASKLRVGNSTDVGHTFAITNVSTQNQELTTKLLKLLQVTNSSAGWIRFMMLVQPLLPFLSRRKLRTTNQYELRSILLGEKCSQLQTDAVHSSSD